MRVWRRRLIHQPHRLCQPNHGSAHQHSLRLWDALRDHAAFDCYGRHSQLPSAVLEGRIVDNRVRADGDVRPTNHRNRRALTDLRWIGNSCPRRAGRSGCVVRHNNLRNSSCCGFGHRFSTAAIQACQTALAAGNCIFQAGYYRHTSRILISTSSTGMACQVTGGTQNTPVALTPTIPCEIIETSSSADNVDIWGTRHQRRDLPQPDQRICRLPALALPPLGQQPEST